jgi:hypothetical protein
MKTTLLLFLTAVTLVASSGCGPVGASVSTDSAPGAMDDALGTGVGAGRACNAALPCMRGLTCQGSPPSTVCAPPAPMALTSQGGPVDAAMQVWTVVWPGYEAAGTSLDAFNALLFRSTYWSQVTAEYGIGAGTTQGVIALSGPLPTSLNGGDFDGLVASLPGSVALDGSIVPPPNESTVFDFLIPKGTPAGGYYHSETTGRLPSASGALIHVPYIVMPQDSVGFVSDEDYLTWSQTHELVETATDPHCNTDLAWYAFQEELADMCNDIPVWTTMPDQSVHAVSRIWSVARAAANDGDPCVPGLGGPYANVVSRPAQVLVPRGGAESTQVTLVPFSYGTGASVHWKLYVSAAYRASPGEGDVAPGDVATLTLTRVGEALHSTMNVWVTDPSAPNANIPLAEWFGYISPE